MPTVLIADDEKNIRATLARSLRLEGYATLEAGDGAEAFDLVVGGEVDLIILDLQMPVVDGLGLLEKMAERGSSVPALVLTAHGTIEKAVHAVRLGAFDFIEKPPSVERILVAVSNALRAGRLEEENRRLAAEAGLAGGLLGTSAPMRELTELIGRVAPTEAGVLIQGENGSGKELVARAIHAASSRRNRLMVTVNCAAIPESLFESELFGHQRGAFTGASEARRGKFQQAHGGTLFLDEIGEVPLSLQPKMLRAIETGEVERIGGREPEKVDVRVIAATNRDLEAEVRSGRFREDLYYRLLVIPIRVRPLRDRREDIPLLARHFLGAACRRNRIRQKSLSAEAIAVLGRHDWPGNVRELRNGMERLAILVSEEEIAPRHVEPLVARAASLSLPGSPTARSSASAPFDLGAALEEHERKLILEVLEKNHWRMAATARDLGLERSHLYKKLKALGIDRPGEE